MRSRTLFNNSAKRKSSIFISYFYLLFTKKAHSMNVRANMIAKR